MKKYVLATALMLIFWGGAQGNAASAPPCATELANMNKQCGASGTTQSCGSAITTYANCLYPIGNAIQACQQQAQTIDFNCITLQPPSAQSCPGELQQLATCIASAQNPPPTGGPPGPNTNPQSDFNSNGQSDYRLGCPYLQTDANGAKTAVKCRALVNAPAPGPY